jgi:2-amino-4-hydroxy-6-hydroxymethyldihydropteridine diphosphokinase
MILVAIGANLPGPGGQPPIETCRAAALALDNLPGLRLVGLSRWYRTRPEPRSDQPDYVNGVAHLSGYADPARLLSALLAIEAAAGRQRTEANAARSLDLDIVAMDELARDTPDPVLPHPRAHERGFVLLPLRDVAPGWVHPRLGRSVAALIAGLRPPFG